MTPGAPRPPEPAAPARVISDPGELAALVEEARTATRLAVDLEASGYHAYRARICTVQLAWSGHVAIVDTLAVPVEGLGALLGDEGPVKIVHDVGFDARLLAELGVELGNVHDTSIAARMLARTATGLASLLESELGLHISKDLQQHDWRLRPFDERTLRYLQQDVVHLEALEARLWAEVDAAGITAEVLEETRYRLASAVEAVRTFDPAPPYVRVKGSERLPERELAVLRVVAELREREAERRDVPPHRVASADALLALARARPRSAAEVARVRGISSATGEGVAFVARLAQAIAGAGETLPVEERVHFDRPKPPPAEVRALREREGRITAWRQHEAARRKVDEQVVLPGHCVKHLAVHVPATVEELRAVPGFGAFRAERDGPSLLLALHGESPAA